MTKTKLITKDLCFSFEEETENMDFILNVNIKTPKKKAHIIILEKPKKVVDASTKLF